MEPKVKGGSAVMVAELDVEHLVTWALRDQGLGSSAAAYDGGWQALGTRVDTSRWSVPLPSAALWTDDDAMVVRAAIDALPPEAGALVLQHGRVGGRPEWCEEGVGSWVQEHDGRGRPCWDWADPVNRTGAKSPRLVFEGTRPAIVTFYRAQYTLWFEGLRALVAPLNLRLATHRAFGPFAPAAPWEAVRPVILEGKAPLRRAS